jgi:photosystem II stability/assembly factor-like uncharacterized protein
LTHAERQPRRHRLHPGRLLLAGMLAVGSSLCATAAAAAAPCANTTELRDTWVQAPMPAGLRASSVAELSADPCVMFVADGTKDLSTTTDGGRTWVRQGLTRPVVGVFGEGLPPGHVIAAYKGGGLAISRNSGHTFTDVAPAGAGEVRTVVGNPSDPAILYLLVETATAAVTDLAAPLPSLYISTDGGTSFTPAPGSAGLRPTAVAVDPAKPLVMWLNDTSAAAAGSSLWVSADGGRSFAPPPSRKTDTATDLAFGTVPDGPSRLIVANGTSGLFETSNDGSSWEPHKVGSGEGQPTLGVRFEAGQSRGLMAVASSGIWRSTNGAASFRQTEGLPLGCGARGITRDGLSPSTFLLACADGAAYRYTSSGGDLATVGAEDGKTVPPPIELDPRLPLPTTPLPVLGVRRLPVNDGSSGSLAFDGETFYYGPPPVRAFAGYGAGVIHRMRVSDGQALPDLTLPFDAAEMSYDGLRNVLYVQSVMDGSSAKMYSLDLLTGRVKEMFPLPSWAASPMTYDASINRFVVAVEGRPTVFQVDLTGRIRSQCDVPDDDQERRGASSMVAAGYGGSGYWQSEDDEDVWHIDGRCRVLAKYTHRHFSEAKAENDALVCDTITFGKPAIWIRDSDTADVYAYGVPKGYCPIATQLAVTTAGTVDRSSVTPVCASLTIRGGTVPLPGMALQFTVGGRGLGSATTDVAGHACLPYRADTRATRSAAHGALERVDAIVAFLGTPSYVASAGDGVLRIRDLPTIAPPLPPPGLAAVPFVPPHLPPPNAAPHPAPQPNPQPQPQAQAQAQSQAQSQSQAQAQAAAVPQVQEQVQVAENTVSRNRELSRYRPRRAAPFDGRALGYGFAAVMAAVAWTAQRRTQPAYHPRTQTGNRRSSW